jgi:outer membrane protein OmpA-like peptidoglycan-associated protein
MGMSSSPAPRDVTREDARDAENGSGDHLAQLRELLLGPEQRQLQELQQRLDDPALRAEELSQLVAEAIALRAKRDLAVQKTLYPIVEEGLRLSVERNPHILATSLFPIIGEAVRKAVAHALRGMVESLNQLLERGFSWESLKWRVEAVRTGKSFGEIALMRSLRYRVEQVFLIHRETGLLLQHVAAPGQVVQDTDLVSGMLTAVQDFVRDSFSGRKSDDLETMQVGEYTVWLQHGPGALLAAVVSGVPPPELRLVFQRALEHIHRDYGPALDSFQGDASPLAGARQQVQACLLGKQVAERRKSYKWAWALGLALLVLLAAVFYWYRQDRRWTRYVDRLRAEPGIMLTSAEKHWLGYSVVGLRDPLAADPGDLLRASGIDPRKVSSRWEPYLSMDPSFVLARRLAAQKEQIEAQVIRFELNSSRLQPNELVKLDQVLGQFRILQRHARFSGQKITVEIYGHTDRTGQEQANELLSQHRAEEVARALAERGISPQMLRPLGVGASAPAQPESSTYLQELNRRVTFKVVLPAATAPR